MAVRKFEKSFLRNGNVRVHKNRTSLSFELHRHEYFEIICYCACSGAATVNGKKFEITDGSVFLLTPTDFHEIETETNESSHSVIVSFTSEIIDENILRTGKIGAAVLYGADDYLLSCFEKMHELFTSQKDGHNVQTNHLINYALAEILLNGNEIASDNSYNNPKIREAVGYVLSNIEGDTTLSSVAAHVGLSSAYFSARFSEVMGKNYKSWLKEIKLERAKRMLESTDEDIITVAYECGYNSPSHFIKIFGEATGLTPKDYRRRVCQK